MSRLERHYRRLLACYPKDHRERNGEEMLGVLLAGAGDRTRPRWRESADLLWGALRLHLRRVVAVDGGVNPGDVLAVVSLLGPVALLAGAALGLHELAWWLKNDMLGDLPMWRQIPDAPVWVGWFVVAVLVLFGLRRTAAVGAWLSTVGFVLLTWAPTQWRWTTFDAGLVLLGALTAAALTWSPGPARGRELVGRRGIVVITVTVAAATALGVFAHQEDIADWTRLLVLAVGTFVACGARSRTGRRAALVLLAPVMSALLVYVSLGVPIRLSTSAEVAVFYGIPAAVLLALGGVPRRLTRPRAAG